MYQNPYLYNHLYNRNSQYFDNAGQYANGINNGSNFNNTTNQYTGNLNTVYNGMTMPFAFAHIKGGPLASQLKGVVIFRNVSGGTEVCVEVVGLPEYKPAQNDNPPIGPHGFHIHETGNCTVGNPSEPFKEAGEHWNPANQPHGNHAGDFPVLFSNNGYARMCFFTNKFAVQDVIGRAVIIHENPDDKTQPAGAAGKRLGCGVIRWAE